MRGGCPARSHVGTRGHHRRGGGAVRRVPRARALSARVREGGVALQATSGGDTPSSARAKCATARRARARRPSRGDQTAVKRIFRVGIRSVRDSKIESTVRDSSIRARYVARGARRLQVFNANEKCATTRAPRSPTVAPRPSHALVHTGTRDGRGEASVSRTPRRPGDALAGVRPPRGFGDRVGRVRRGGLDRPGGRHLSPPSLPSRPSPRRVRPSRGLDRVALPLERRARRRARRSARGRVRRSLRAHLHRPKRQGRGHPRARDLRPARSRPAQALLRPHRQHARRRAHGPRVHPPLRASRVPRRVPRATGPHPRRRSRRVLRRRRRRVARARDGSVRRRRRRRARRRRRRARPRRAPVPPPHRQPRRIRREEPRQRQRPRPEPRFPGSVRPSRDARRLPVATAGDGGGDALVSKRKRHRRAQLPRGRPRGELPVGRHPG